MIESSGRNNCYKLKTLELIKRKNLILGLIQENSIENSIQDCLSYILVSNGLCKLLLAYPKQPYIGHKVNMCCIYCMILFFQNLLLLSICLITCDHVI